MRPGSARSAWDKAAYAEASRAGAERCAGTPRGGQGGGRAPAAAGRVLVTWRVLASPPASRRVQCARAHPGAAPGARVWRTGRARGRGAPRRGAGDAGGGTAERAVGPARFPEGRGAGRGGGRAGRGARARGQGRGGPSGRKRRRLSLQPCELPRGALPAQTPAPARGHPRRPGSCAPRLGPWSPCATEQVRPRTQRGSCARQSPLGF